MELITPEALRRQYKDKDLKEIIEEKKKIETKLAEMEAQDTFGTAPSVVAQNAQDTSWLASLEVDENNTLQIAETDRIKVSSSGENSERSIYMSYQRVLNDLIKEKNEYMNEIEYKQMLRTKNADELMLIRNKLVADINKYYKETNSMRTKSMLMSLPFTKWLVKNKNVNENTDSLEVIMKKEEYVKYIEELQADPHHFDAMAEAQLAASEQNNPQNPQQ